MSRYDSRKFELELPDHWRDSTVYSFDGPEDRGVKHSLLITVDEEPGTGDLAVYARERIAALMDALDGAEVLKEGPFRLASGLDGYEVVYKWVPAGDKVLFQRQAWVLTDGRAFNFAASFSKQSLKTVGPEVDGIIDSFVPGEAPPRESGGGGKKFLIFGKKAPKGVKKPAVKKPKVKKPVVKKPVVKKPVVKKPAVKKPAVKKPTVKKPQVKKPNVRKP